MAGNKEIVDFPVLSAPIGSEMYAVKSDTDYRVPVGAALGIATLGADGKVPSGQLPPPGGAGTVTSINIDNATGISFTGGPITTTGSLTPALSANLLAWNALATSAKADTSHVHAASDITSGTFVAARLGSGTADGSKYLAGDLTWQTYAAGGGGGTVTSISFTGGTGISASGGPITTSGTITLALSANLQSWSALATSAKANASHTHAASDITSGVLGTARLGTGIANSGTILYGDGTWKAAPGGGGGGTVTSIDVSGGTTGFSFSGGPITGSGTLTASGTLVVANGGTGMTSLTTGSYINAVSSSAFQLRTPAQVLSDIGGAAVSHTHSATDITSGTLAVARGGTGIASYTTGNYIQATGATTLSQRTPANVLSDIGAAASGHTHTPASLGAVANGGSIATITKITQAAYTALGSKDANTLYIIVG